MTNVIEKCVDDLVCVMLDVHIWGGRRILNREDLLAANPALSKLPSEKLASLGAYKLCDPELLRQFDVVRGRAERYLKRQGLSLLGAVGITPEKYQNEAYAKLLAFQAEFNALGDAFLKQFDVAVQNWATTQLLENPDYAHLFNQPPSREHVEKRLSFTFHAYRVNAPAAEDGSAMNSHYDTQVRGLKGELMRDVAAEAGTLVNEYLLRKQDGVVTAREYVTPRTLGPLIRAAAKLDDFRFLDPSIGPLSDLINEVVASADAQRIEGKLLMKVWSLSKLLSDPERAVELAAAATEGKSSDDLLGAMTIAQGDASPAIARVQQSVDESPSAVNVPSDAQSLSLLL